jgi:hypothetical protein
VIEVHVGPFRSVVTGATILAVLSSVHIVQTVAVVTLLWRVLVTLRRVAGRATGLQMLPAQGEIGAVVVKFLFAPAGVVVAVGTGLPEYTAMDIIIAVTVDTLRRRFSPGFVGLVATATGRKAVGAAQWKIGESVVEAVSIQ